MPAKIPSYLQQGTLPTTGPQLPSFLPGSNQSPFNTVLTAPLPGYLTPPGGWGNGSVLGDNTTAPAPVAPVTGGGQVPVVQPPAPFNPGGGSGGGSYTVGPSAAEKKLAEEKAALLEKQKNEGLAFADQAYADMIANLNNQEGQIKTGYTSGQDYINSLKNSNISDLTNQGDLSKRQARQSYQDSILQARLRARALGGAASSGFMDMTGRLDQALASNLTGIDTTNMSAMSKVKLTADKALTDLQAEMEKNINEIANQKNLSLREKDKAKAQIQMEAAQGALDIKSWLDGKIKTVSTSGGSSIASQAAAYKAQVLGQFDNAINGIQGSTINSNSPEFQNILAKFGPALTSVGVNPNTLTGYYGGKGYTPKTDQEFIDDYKSSLFSGWGSYEAQNPELP